MRRGYPCSSLYTPFKYRNHESETCDDKKCNQWQKPDRKIGHLGIYTTPLAVNNKKVQYAIAVQSYALPFNVLESPIVSLPIALSKNGLPIGVQLVGKKNSDFDLLEVAISLVKITPTIGNPKV